MNKHWKILKVLKCGDEEMNRNSRKVINMELTKVLEKSITIANLGYSNVTTDKQNDIINLDYKDESYRIIIEKVE